MSENSPKSAAQSAVKSTPLRAAHESLGAKMVEFAGWWMPVQYKGLKEEHFCVRSAVGLFDVSHMGEIRVKGERSLETLQWLTTNDVSKLKAGQAQYSLYPNPEGGIVDDLIVYCVEPGHNYLLCVNAANVDKDFAFMLKNNRGADITNESAQWAQIAVQGPKARKLMQRVFGDQALKIETFCFAMMPFKGASCMIARTGYTGEDGAEVFVPASLATELWQELLAKGQDLGVQPIGLGARDTLRTEMKYSLYGHEIDDTSSPYEAGLGWVVKPEAKAFLGREAMLAVKAAGLKKKLIGFKMEDRGIPRQGHKLMTIDNREIGTVTSGTLSPTLNESIGIGYVSSELAAVGTEICVDLRGRLAKARVVKTPFAAETSLAVKA